MNVAEGFSLPFLCRAKSSALHLSIISTAQAKYLHHEKDSRL